MENKNETAKISGIYTSTAIAGHEHTEGRTAMSTQEMRERANAEYESGNINAVDLTAMMKYLDKREYNQKRNRLPEVKAQRKAYNQKQAAIRREGKLLLSLLSAKKEE